MGKWITTRHLRALKGWNRPPITPGSETGVSKERDRAVVAGHTMAETSFQPGRARGAPYRANAECSDAVE
jgi:hypothetical protein